MDLNAKEEREEFLQEVWEVSEGKIENLEPLIKKTDEIYSISYFQQFLKGSSLECCVLKEFLRIFDSRDFFYSIN